MGSDALTRQFQAQLAALQALAAGDLPSDATVLAACRGQVPTAAVDELREAAAAAERHLRPTNGAAAVARDNADDRPGSVKPEPVSAAAPGGGDAAAAAEAGEASASGAAGSEQRGASEQAGRIQDAIRAKLRQLVPQQRRVQQEVLCEQALNTQCSEFRLLDWRRMRRPLPGANRRAFEPPLQPTALLMQQQAARAQRVALTTRVERLQLMRLHLDRQRKAQLHAQEQEQQGNGVAGGAAGMAGGGHPVPQHATPFSSSGMPATDAAGAAGQQRQWQAGEGLPYQAADMQPTAPGAGGMSGMLLGRAGSGLAARAATPPEQWPQQQQQQPQRQQQSQQQQQQALAGDSGMWPNAAGTSGRMQLPQQLQQQLPLQQQQQDPGPMHAQGGTPGASEHTDDTHPL